MSELVVANKKEVEKVEQQANPVQVLTMISNLVQKDNFDIHALEKLIALQNDAEDRQAKKAFNSDLSEMLSEIPVIAKTGVNTFNGTKFAKLEDIVEKTRPILHKYGFSVTYKQEQEMIDGAKTEPNSIFCMMTVTCILKHHLGHEESNSIQLPIATIKGQTPIQAMGMGSTYGRRYTLMQALNIAVAEEDNDGSFVVNVKAESNKRKLSDNQIDAAIKKIKANQLSVDDLVNGYDLTAQQLMKVGKELNA